MCSPANPPRKGDSHMIDEQRENLAAQAEKWEIDTKGKSAQEIEDAIESLKKDRPPSLTSTK